MTRAPGKPERSAPPRPRRQGKELSVENQILARRMLAAGMRKADVAGFFGLSPPTLRRILIHVPEWDARTTKPGDRERLSAHENQKGK